ncbi:MAG: hypothetical protein LBQ47_05230 [Endomicrobium sp.]|jgi:hypothetical protein|nr:hypothetical protein [Endomicrobium sp.]
MKTLNSALLISNAEYKYKLNKASQVLREPIASWGGQWTEQKLIAFEKYVNAYLTIMNKNRDKYN